MKVYSAQNIKNIAVVGHGSEGKTTLVEALLYNSGAIDRMGKVEDGNTTTDFDPEEIKRQISITTALAPVEWKDYKLNLIDAPGYFDFVSEITQAYYLADSALILVSAVSGVGVGAEKAYKFCKDNSKPMAVVVNQMDKEHVNYQKAIDELKDKFGAAITQVQLPIMKGGAFAGFVDIIEQQAYEFAGKDYKKADIPADLASEVESIREALIENAAGNDEELMEKYFGGEDLTKEDIYKGFKLGILEQGVIPVFVCAAAPNLGMTALADQLVELMPSASAMKPVMAKDEADNDVQIAIDESAPLAAQVLKTIADPFVGKLNIVKVYAGVLSADVQVINMTTGKPEKCNNISIMRGKKNEAVKQINAGDIGALAKLAHTNTGDSLCAASRKVTFPELFFGKPCISLSVASKKSGDEEKIFAGLHRLEEEDPAFKLTKQLETGETLATGMGELHLEVIMQKLKNKFGVEAVLSDPKVPYRETIKKTVSAEGKHKKQSGGAGQFGVVQITFEPIYDGEEEFEFVDKIVGGVVPRQFIPAVEKGLRESMKKGVLAGYPMVNVRCTLFDGKYHPVDSKEVAFTSAARLAYKAGCAQAGPALLEPICNAKVLIPDEYMGDIIGDLNRRRGRILGMNPQEGGLQEVEAEVPMAEMFKYATDLRSMTQGRGLFDLEVVRYEEVPAQMAAKIVEQAKHEDEE